MLDTLSAPTDLDSGEYGVADMVDYDVLEEELAAGKYVNVREWNKMLDEVAETPVPTNQKARMRARVRAGLFPEFRAMLDALPSTGSGRITPATVVEIRQRAAAGEKRRVLAAEFGVGEYAIRDVVTRRTWKQVA